MRSLQGGADQSWRPKWSPDMAARASVDAGCVAVNIDAEVAALMQTVAMGEENSLEKSCSTKSTPDP